MAESAAKVAPKVAEGIVDKGMALKDAVKGVNPVRRIKLKELEEYMLSMYKKKKNYKEFVKEKMEKIEAKMVNYLKKITDSALDEAKDQYESERKIIPKYLVSPKSTYKSKRREATYLKYIDEYGWKPGA